MSDHCSMASSVTTYSMPTGVRLALGLTPRLESWNARDHPDQVRLREFVAHVRSLIEPIADDIFGPLAVHLHVGLDDSIDPLWQRDLDNYLFPIARELPARYVSIWGTKGRADDSFVTVGPAVSASPPDWPDYPVPRAPGGETSWKHAVRDAVNAAEQLPPGPVGMQIALTVGASRSWANSWKRTIDGLEPLLGPTYAHRDWNPQDGRIVRLGLHVAVDPDLEHDVDATIWAKPGDLDWPELGWFKNLSDAERRAFMDAHQAVLDKVASSQRLRPAAPSATAATAQRTGRRGRPPIGLTAGVMELKTEDDFEQAVADNALIVKTDSAGPPKLHLRPQQCSGVTVDNFRLKVVIGRGKNGRYYRTSDAAAARQRWPRLRLCASCRQLDPVRGRKAETRLA
jgi:hypothetical protein